MFPPEEVRSISLNPVGFFVNYLANEYPAMALRTPNDVIHDQVYRMLLMRIVHVYEYSAINVCYQHIPHAQAPNKERLSSPRRSPLCPRAAWDWSEAFWPFSPAGAAEAFGMTHV